MPTEVKYGEGYVILHFETGPSLKVTVEKKGRSDTATWKPYPVKDVAKLAEALR